MMSDVAILVRDDLEAIAVATKSKHHRDISESYKLQRDSRNYLFLRYGADGVAEYIRQMKEACHASNS